MPSSTFVGLSTQWVSMRWTLIQQFLPRFYRLATVSMLSNMMVPLAGLADTAFLGHLGDIRYLGGVILGSLLFDYPAGAGEVLAQVGPRH